MQGRLQNDETLNQIVQRLVSALHPERVYLFGSHARGEAGADSDYDLLVVIPDSVPAGRARSRIAYEALWGLPRAGDIVVTRQSHFNSRLHLASSLPSTVLREGELLYAA